MFNNIGVKTGALLIALLLWLHVVTEKTYTHTFHVSLEPVNLAEDLIIANELPDHFKVSVRGTGKQLLLLFFSDIVLTLDLHDTIQSKSRFRLKQADVVINRDIDVTVMEIEEPDFVDVDIDRLMRKTVPVVPRIEVEPADGYVVLDAVEAIPDTAIISGPRRFVEIVDTLYTEEEAVQKAKSRMRREVALILPEGLYVDIVPDRIMTDIKVQKVKQRVISDIPVVLLHTPSNRPVNLDTSRITLTIKGGEELISTLTPEDFQVSIDYRQVSSGSTDVATPDIQTPPHTTWTEAKPQIFRIIEPES